MDSDRWERVGQVFSRAVELTGDELEQFLADACRGDTELRAEVESLLEAAGRSGFADEFSDVGFAEVIARSAFGQSTPNQVGPFRIIRELGHGGMGTVYLAERTDPQFKQRVALKLITTAIADDEILSRFLRERQVLARLAHPNIARLLDGGVTDTGRPYFAMDYVVGLPIDSYADRHALGVEERLVLFRQVCEAIQFAHQNLVVHRDIKPSNILVTEDGVVKLLDFGIAKLLGDEGDPTATTVTGRRLMTPDFASPEQVRGEAIGTASDVYSLGVLLHRLLSGRKPYRLTSDVPYELGRVICEEDPIRPSAAVSTESPEDLLSVQEIARLRSTYPGKLQRRLSGDLDTIVLKALRKDPARRYVSAGQFLDDIDRYLSGLPVQARPDTFVYRASKFVRRHRVGVLSAVLVFLSLVGGLAGTAWQAVVAANEAERAAIERDRAQRESAKAERVTAYLIDLFSESDPAQARGDTMTARQLLDVGTARIDEYFDNQPEARSALMDAVGRIYQSLGLYTEARRLIEGALAIRQSLFEGDHEDKAESLDHIGVLLYELGEFAAADSLLSTALAMRRRLYPSAHGSVAASLDNLGQVRHDTGNFSDADTLYREALAIRRRLFGPRDERIATSLNNLAVLHHDRGELKKAEALYREALEMDRAVLGDRHPGVAVDLNNLGRLFYDTGDLEKATELFEDALTLRRLVLGERHPDVGTSANNLAAALHERGELQAAEALYREALQIREASFGREHPRVAVSLNNLASVLEDRGDIGAAEAMFRESLEMRRRLFGNEHSSVATNLHNLGRVLGKQGRTRSALAHLREAVSIREAQLGPNHRLVAASLQQLGELLLASGDADSAEAALRRAVSISEAALPPGHPSTSEARELLEKVVSRRARLDGG